MIEISSIMSGMWLAYDHLCDILHISPTNDFYEMLVPVTLPYMRGIRNFVKVIGRRYLEDIAQVIISQVYAKHI